jgi:hypothetical protein
MSKNSAQMIDVAFITAPNLPREKYLSERTLDRPAVQQDGLQYDTRYLEEDNKNLQQP